MARNGLDLLLVDPCDQSLPLARMKILGGGRGREKGTLLRPQDSVNNELWRAMDPSYRDSGESWSWHGGALRLTSSFCS